MSRAIFLVLILLGSSPASTAQSDFWTFSGFPVTFVSAVGSHPNGRLFAWPVNGFLNYSTDWGENWIQTSILEYGPKVFLTDQRGMLFVAGDGFHRSSDGGLTWEAFPDVYPTSAKSIVADQNNFLLVGLELIVDPPGYRGGGIYRSVDDGETWELLGFEHVYVAAIAVTPDGDIVLSSDYGIYRSSDGGTSWEYLIYGPYSDALLATTSGKIIAGTHSGIFCSTDGGDTWSQTLDDDVTIKSFAYHPEGKILAAAGTGSVYLSEDAGETWGKVDSGIRDYDAVDVAFDSRGFGLAATSDNGVFRSSDRITGVNEDEERVPDQFSLMQNFPNPFNPSTTISFSIPQSSVITLTIFNLLGEEVATLISGRLDAGTHTVQWDATGYPSSVYFYRLSAGSYVETKKLVLLR